MAADPWPQVLPVTFQRHTEPGTVQTTRQSLPLLARAQQPVKCSCLSGASSHACKARSARPHSTWSHKRCCIRQGCNFLWSTALSLARQGVPAFSGLQVARHQCKWCLNHEVPGKNTAPTASWQSFYGASESCLRLLDSTGREIGTNASSATVPAICGNSSAGCGLC